MESREPSTGNPATADSDTQRTDAERAEPVERVEQAATQPTAPRHHLKVVLTLDPHQPTDAARAGGANDTPDEASYRALVSVGSDGCDPLIRSLDAPLPTILDEVPGLVADAETRWTTDPRFPRAAAPVKLSSTAKTADRKLKGGAKAPAAGPAVRPAVAAVASIAAAPPVSVASAEPTPAVQAAAPATLVTAVTPATPAAPERAEEGGPTAEGQPPDTAGSLAAKDPAAGEQSTRPAAVTAKPAAGQLTLFG